MRTTFTIILPLTIVEDMAVWWLILIINMADLKITKETNPCTYVEKIFLD